MENILAKRLSDARPAKQTDPYGALGSAAPVCFAPSRAAIFSRQQRSLRHQLDQDKFVATSNFNDPSPHMPSTAHQHKNAITVEPYWV